MELLNHMSGKPKQEQKPAIEYTAQAASPLICGEVKLTVDEKALLMTALFDVAEVPFAEINALILVDYVITVKIDGGDYVFSKMGRWCQPFYDALRDAYNKAVLRALFVKSTPILTAAGNYRHTENDILDSGTAPFHVYANSIVALPPDLGARRVPLCFVSGMDKGEYELTLKLNTGETYTYAKLGYNTSPFAEAVEKQIRELRERSLSAVKELDPTLTATQASQIAILMPPGASAPFGRLSAIAPSFAAALEARLAGTRAVESYQAFKEFCGRERIYVGFKKSQAASDSVTDGGHTETTPPVPYLLWLIAPSPDGKFAAVEFAEADSATFVYCAAGGFDAFAAKLNRALEAIDFKREVIYMSDEELRKPENADYYMAAKRTAALQFVRANFVGRIIHSGAETWKRKLTELWSGA